LRTDFPASDFSPSSFLGTPPTRLTIHPLLKQSLMEFFVVGFFSWVTLMMLVVFFLGFGGGAGNSHRTITPELRGSPPYLDSITFLDPLLSSSHLIFFFCRTGGTFQRVPLSLLLTFSALFKLLASSKDTGSSAVIPQTLSCFFLYLRAFGCGAKVPGRLLPVSFLSKI